PALTRASDEIVGSFPDCERDWRSQRTLPHGHKRVLSPVASLSQRRKPRAANSVLVSSAPDVATVAGGAVTAAILARTAVGRVTDLDALLGLTITLHGSYPSCAMPGGGGIRRPGALSAGIIPRRGYCCLASVPAPRPARGEGPPRTQP